MLTTLLFRDLWKAWECVQTAPHIDPIQQTNERDAIQEGFLIYLLFVCVHIISGGLYVAITGIIAATELKSSGYYYFYDKCTHFFLRSENFFCVAVPLSLVGIQVGGVKGVNILLTFLFSTVEIETCTIYATSIFFSIFRSQ